MIVLSNTAVQTIPAGGSVVFNDVILHTGCGECHRKNTGSVKLRANGIYSVGFGANISGTADSELTLAIQLGGATLPETTMIFTPETTGALGSVYRETAVKNCCGDYDRVTVVNTGNVAVTIDANPVLKIVRVS